MQDFLQDIPDVSSPESDILLDTVQDIMDNGGDIPTNVSNRMILGAIRKSYKVSIQGLNTAKRIQIHLWALTGMFFAFVAVAVAVRYNDLHLINAVHQAAGLPSIIIFP